MQAPLGNLIRKMLLNEKASKQLMRHLIVGKRFNLNETIEFDEKKFKLIRVGSVMADAKK